MSSAKKRPKVSVILDEPEYRRFESYCEAKGFKKSTLIARLIRDHLDREGYQLQQSLLLDTAKASAVTQ